MSTFKIINKELKYSFLLDDSWQELKKDSYSKFGLQGNVLHLFLQMKDNKIAKAIHVNKELLPASSESDYLKLVNLNIRNLQEAQFFVSNPKKIVLKSGIRTDKIYITDSKVKMTMIFAYVNNYMLSFSTGIIEENDDLDKEFTNIVSTLSTIE